MPTNARAALSCLLFLPLAAPACAQPADGGDDPTTGSSSTSSSTSSTDDGSSTTTSSSPDSESSSSDGGASSTGSGVGDGCDAHVTFATIRAMILPSCGGYISCHLKFPTGGSLDLRDDVAYANLVDVPSAIAPAELRVASGDSANSLLYRKLIDQLPDDDSEGGPMPKTATATMWAPLDPAQVELVRCWIDGGAQDD